MTLIPSLIKTIILPLSQSLIPTGADDDDLIIPITTDLIVHVAAFQDGKTKAQLVNVDVGDLVEDWFGITSTIFDANQLTGDRQPLYTASAINSHPAIDFDGSNDVLDFGSISGYNPGSDNFTVLAVVQYNNNSATKTVLSHNIVAESYLTTNTDVTWGSQVGSGSLTGGSFTNNPTILTLRYNGTTLFIYTNGNLDNSASKTPTSTTASLLIGARNTSGSSPTDGFIGEIALYKQSLSDSDRGEVETYLSNKWDIALT